MPNDKKDIMKEFIKSYEICASFINKVVLNFMTDNPKS